MKGRERERERTEAARYSLITLSRYHGAAFCGIRMTIICPNVDCINFVKICISGCQPSQTLTRDLAHLCFDDNLRISPIVPDDHEGPPSCLAKRVSHRNISRKNIPSLSRHRITDSIASIIHRRILQLTGFISDWKGAK